MGFERSKGYGIIGLIIKFRVGSLPIKDEDLSR